MEIAILAGLIGLVIGAFFFGLHFWKTKKRQKKIEAVKTEKTIMGTLRQNIWFLFGLFFAVVGVLSFTSLI